MKRIKLINYTAPNTDSVLVKDRLYSVSLGNGYTNSFASKTETLAFLAQTNRDLSHKLYELNFLYADVMRIYRLAWPYFETGSKRVPNNLQGIVLEKIADTEHIFNLLVDRGHWENGNHLAFQHFQAIIGLLKEICTLLAELYGTKNHSVNMYECSGLITRLNYIHTAIVMYPQQIQLVAENRYFKAVMKVV